MTTESPVRFETIAKALGVDSRQVWSWAQNEAGFPVAGKGVALLSAVKAWRESLSPMLAAFDAAVGGAASAESEKPADPQAQPPLTLAESLEEPAEETVFRWVTIRVPIAVRAPRLAGMNPIQSFRIRSSEEHIRGNLAALIHGCRHAGVQLKSGTKVVDNSAALKFLLEQLASSI